MTLVIQATVRGAAPKLVGLENDDGPGSKNKNRALFFEATADLKVVASNPFVLSLTQQYGYFFFFRQTRVGGTKEDKGIALDAVTCCYISIYPIYCTYIREGQLGYFGVFKATLFYYIELRKCKKNQIQGKLICYQIYYSVCLQTKVLRNPELTLLPTLIPTYLVCTHPIQIGTLNST